MKNFIARLRGDTTRKSAHSKDLQIYATDVDYGIIVMSSTNPKFSSLILDKYLLVCEYGDVTPLIVLNKTDLFAEPPSVMKYYEKALNIKVVSTSVPLNTGIETLRELISGKTCVFLGKSGVGKSSLINALSGKEDIKVGDVSAGYGEGKHTTTSTERYLIGENTWVIDTPGLRNIDVSNISPEVLVELYPDFLKLAGGCKFSNCLHFKEPGCAVKNAVESGEVLSERYENYLKIGGF